MAKGAALCTYMSLRVHTCTPVCVWGKGLRFPFQRLLPVCSTLERAREAPQSPVDLAGPALDFTGKQSSVVKTVCDHGGALHPWDPIVG